MKVTKKQLRRIIKEEAARPFPIDYYPDEMLMQEGLWDAISNFLGSIVGFFTDAWGEAEDNVKGETQKYQSKYTGSNWKKMVKDVDPKGKGDPPSEDEVDWTDEKWAAAWWGSWTAYAPELLKKVQDKLDATTSVVDWVPPEGTSPEEWMKGDGKAALGVNSSFGSLIGIMDDLSAAVPELKSAVGTLRGLKPEDAGAAAAGIVQAVDAIGGSSAKGRAEASAKKDIWKKLPHTGDIGAAISALTAISAAAGAIEMEVKAAAEKQAEAIEAAAKEIGPPAEDAKDAFAEASDEDEEAALAAVEDAFADIDGAEPSKLKAALEGDPSEFIAAAELEEAEPMEVADALVAASEELTSDGDEEEEEAANEWVLLRRHVNALILHERRKRKK